MERARPIATAENRGPIVNVLSWLLAITVFLCTFVRVATRIWFTRSIALDDVAITTALVFSVGYCVVTSITVTHGLGRHESELSGPQLEGYQKATYAADFLYISTLTFSKLSVLFLVRLLSPKKSHLQTVYIFLGVIICWALSSLLVNAFQCSVPRTWAILSQRCIHQTSFWNYFEALNIVTEIGLIALPVTVIGNVRIKVRKKYGIIGAFASRICVIASIVVHLVYLNQRLPDSDRTYLQWRAVMAQLFVQASSNITACIPYLKNFYESLESGFIRSDDALRREARSLPSSDQPSQPTWRKNAWLKAFGPSSNSKRLSRHSRRKDSMYDSALDTGVESKVRRSQVRSIIHTRTEIRVDMEEAPYPPQAPAMTNYTS